MLFQLLGKINVHEKKTTKQLVYCKYSQRHSKNLYEQILAYLDNTLSEYPCGFRKGYTKNKKK